MKKTDSKGKILITGITGQDGAWLSKLCIDKGYEVYGGVRRISTPNFWRLEYLKIKDKVKIVDFDLIDQANAFDIVRMLKPDYIFNLAAQSFVAPSFKTPLSTTQMNFMGVMYLLEAIRVLSPETKFYQASTSEMFGKVQEVPQKESTPFYPRSPYGVAKLAAHWATINYRESYGIYSTAGILFNHESELRGEEFVTRKITMHAATWANGNTGKILELGNMNSKRDWGYAKEYVEGMWKIMNHKVADSYILATGETNTIRYFVENAYRVVGKEIIWEGKNEKEVGKDKKTGKVLIRVNPIFYRPAEVELLHGDPSKANKELGWKAKIMPDKLAEIMVKSDIGLLSKHSN
jgi:GDPmannose 4,6-dehydratase